VNSSHWWCPPWSSRYRRSTLKTSVNGSSAAAITLDTVWQCPSPKHMNCPASSLQYRRRSLPRTDLGSLSAAAAPLLLLLLPLRRWNVSRSRHARMATMQRRRSARSLGVPCVPLTPCFAKVTASPSPPSLLPPVVADVAVAALLLASSSPMASNRGDSASAM